MSPRRGKWFKRIFAILFGLSLFVIAELVCVVCDWGRPTDYDDPFVGFSSIHPLFILDDAKKNYFIPDSRIGPFAEETFPAKKNPNTFRVFCLGGSTVQGRPYSHATSFPKWLELGLTATDPSRQWQVINCGGISYASYRLTPILAECLTYEPDLIILCAGHNEFLEERSYANIKHAPPVLSGTRQTLLRLRTAVLLRDLLVTKEEPDRHSMSTEVDALLDHKGGLESYYRDDKWTASVVEHFDHNVRNMIKMARDAGVPMILVKPPSNLSDTPPFKSEHRDGITKIQLDQWKSLFESSQEHYKDNAGHAAQLLNHALGFDDQHALTLYMLGRCHYLLGATNEARMLLTEARDKDICPLRMTSPLENRLITTASESNTPLLDAHQLLERECPGHILGDHMLVDHVHPTFRGNQMIANALIAELERRGWARPDDDWRAVAESAFQEHFATLDDAYFVKGDRTLKHLEMWTRARQGFEEGKKN